MIYCDYNKMNWFYRYDWKRNKEQRDVNGKQLQQKQLRLQLRENMKRPNN